MKVSPVSLLSVLLAFINTANAFAPPVQCQDRVPSRLFAKNKVTVDTSLVGDPSAYEENQAEVQKRIQKQESFVMDTADISNQKDELDQLITKETPTTRMPEVFKGIHLAPWDATTGLGLLNPYTAKNVGAYGQTAPTKNFAIVGQPKDNLDIPRQVLTEFAHLDDDTTSPLPQGYKLFGNSNYEKQLVLLLKTNPFMASALTETEEGGFELKSYDPSDSNPTLFLRMMRTLNGEGHRVNFEFDRHMKIKSFSVYDSKTGKRLNAKELDRATYASSALYNIFFYASSIHATIHVFHFLLTSALLEESKHFPALYKLAESYARNIRNKYGQVGLLLINDAKPPGTDTALITGVNGFGSSQAIRPILEEVLNTWGQTTSARAFFKGFMNVSTKKMDQAGILVEFRKHLDLVRPFSKDLNRAIMRSDKTAYAHNFRKASRGVKSYLEHCGEFKSEIPSLRAWFELMSVTGIIHGSTISYTRILADPGVAQWRNITSDTWDMFDLNLITGGLGTVVGMEEGRHVMGSEVDGGDFARHIQTVLNNYDKRANKLKEAYKEKLLRGNREELNNYGFILTDYGPDNFDGKQLTIATYI